MPEGGGRVVDAGTEGGRLARRVGFYSAFFGLLSLIVVAHEAGHFLAARYMGVGVKVFSVGFGPRVAGVFVGGTDYRISGLPFGGYVEMVGEDPLRHPVFGEVPDTRTGFYSIPPTHRAALAIAGPTANAVLCFLCIWAGFVLGMPLKGTVVHRVARGSPAEKAGILPGDVVTRFNGCRTPAWACLEAALFRVKPGVELPMEVNRAGESKCFAVVPVLGRKDKIAKGLPIRKRCILGLFPETTKRRVRFGLAESAACAARMSADFTLMFLVLLRGVAAGGARRLLSTPIGAAYMIGNAPAPRGRSSLWLAVGLSSMSIGLSNLAPIPMVDGGHVVFSITEILAGQRLGAEVYKAFGFTGSVTLLLLLAIALVNDYLLIFGNGREEMMAAMSAAGERASL